MAGKLQAEIRQSKPLPAGAEAFLLLLRTADSLSNDVAQMLKPADLSPTQYNVLRILRGAGEDGLACSEIGSRMVTRDPDMTRLLDRLEKHGLVTRCRDTKDRRIVMVRITGQALELIAALDQPMAELHRRQFGSLGERRLAELIETLELIRKGE